jgi:uncharacterized protein YprB with RNaseH-like and TPR domain
MSKPRILVFDIETTNLKADFGTVLCVGYKWLGEKTVHVPSIMDYRGWKKDVTYDGHLIRDFKEVYEQADLLVTYFGKGFDVKYLNAKMLEHSLGTLPNTPHVDLFYTVKANLALSRKSLANVGYFLGLSTEKTPVEGRVWKKAQAGFPDAIEYVIRHCDADVKILEEAYLRLRPLVRQHPRVCGLPPCRSCGSNNLQRRGRAMTVMAGPRYRVQCQDCGAWENRNAKWAEYAS